MANRRKNVQAVKQPSQPTVQRGGTPARTAHKEVIGRTQLLAWLKTLRPATPTVDTTQLDYAWWDMFRRGMQPGYEIASRLVSPIAKIRTAWALGDGVQFRLRANLDLERIEYTNEQLSEWAAGIRSQMATLVKDADELGDQYAIVNLDGSISIPPPNTVKVNHDVMDYRRVVSVEVTTILEDIEVHDIYEPERRTIKLKNRTSNPLVTRYGAIAANGTLDFEYDNPLGMIPVIAFHRGRSSNEVNGRAIYSDDLYLLTRYDDLYNKAMDGAALMGTPIPTWEELENIEDERRELETPTGHLEMAEGGEIVPAMSVDIDPNTGMFTKGKFSFKSPPPGFTKDLRDILKLIFLLILEEHQIPETVWGGEMGQARATSIEQMKTFHASIEAFRLDLEGVFEPDKGQIEGLLGLASVWLHVKALTDKSIVVDALSVVWPELAMMDERLMFEKIQYALNMSLMSGVGALHALNVVEDPEGEYEKAQAEAEERDKANQDRFDADVEDALDDEEGDPEEDPASSDEKDAA